MFREIAFDMNHRSSAAADYSSDGPPAYEAKGPVFDAVWMGPFRQARPIQQTSALDLFLAGGVHPTHWETHPLTTVAGGVHPIDLARRHSTSVSQVGLALNLHPPCVTITAELGTKHLSMAGDSYSRPPHSSSI